MYAGDNVIVGSKEGKLCWFDMDLSCKPYKTMRFVIFHDNINGNSFTEFLIWYNFFKNALFYFLRAINLTISLVKSLLISLDELMT